MHAARAALLPSDKWSFQLPGTGVHHIILKKSQDMCQQEPHYQAAASINPRAGMLAWDELWVMSDIL